MDALFGKPATEAAPKPTMLTGSQLLAIYSGGAPAAAPPAAGGPVKPLQINHDQQFDAFWEAMGGTPRVSAAAPRVLPPRSTRAATGPASDFDPFGFGAAAAPASDGAPRPTLGSSSSSSSATASAGPVTGGFPASAASAPGVQRIGMDAFMGSSTATTTTTTTTTATSSSSSSAAPFDPFGTGGAGTAAPPVTAAPAVAALNHAPNGSNSAAAAYAAPPAVGGRPARTVAEAHAAITKFDSHHHDSDEEEDEDEPIDVDVDAAVHDTASLFFGAFGGIGSTHHGAATGVRARRTSSTDLPPTGSSASGGAAAAAATAAPTSVSAPSGGSGTRSRRGSSSGSGGDMAAVAIPSAAAVPAAGTGKAVEPAAIEGPIYLRVTHALIMKRWKERYATLRHGVLRVYTSRSTMMGGEEPLEVLDLTSNMALSSMKTNTSSGTGATRIFYRHIAQLDPSTRIVATGATGGALSVGSSESTVGGAAAAGGGGVAASALDADKAGADGSGSHRAFKFGCDSMAEFERWSRALRAAIDYIGAHEREKAAQALALDTATNASDLFRAAIASPRDRPKRRTSVFSGKLGAASDGLTTTINLPVRLLDGTCHHIVVSKGATVKDVLVALRRILGLKADADYSLYLRQTSADGRDAFACLPDVTPAAEADALALPEHRSLVYRRRVYLPPTVASMPAVAQSESGGSNSPGPAGFAAGGSHSRTSSGSMRPGSGGGSGGGVYSMGLPAAGELEVVDAEEEKADKITDAAHTLAYAEAHFNFLAGNYLLPFQDALILAALHLLSTIGPAKTEAHETAAGGAPSKHVLESYRAHLPEVLPAQAIAEHKATSGKGVDDLVALLRREHLRLSASGMTALAAQKVVIKRVKRLPEYGGAFFTANLVRLLPERGEASGSRSADPTPDWAEELTTEDSHASDAPAPLPVLVAVNAVGIHVRPLPPMHTPSSVYTYAACAPVTAAVTVADPAGAAAAVAATWLGREPTPSERLSPDGRPVSWMTHPVHLIEVWGVKKSRPTFTYRARERHLRVIELTTASFKEVASTLHMFVFALLAQREGQPKRVARAEASDYGALAKATREAMKEAQEEALAKLPAGWSQIVDPLGNVAYWNAVTRETVFSRPTA